MTEQAHAVLWDLGGIVYPTPYEVMDELEAARGWAAGVLPRGPFTLGGDPDYEAVDRGAVSEPDYWRLKQQRLQLAGIEFVATRDIDWTGRERDCVVALLDDIVESPLLQGALTNDSTAFLGEGWMHRWWLADRFATITDSVVIGVRKPDARAYRIACDELGSDPARTIFVDDLHVNCDAAIDAGLQAWWFDVTDPESSTAGLRERIGL